MSHDPLPESMRSEALSRRAKPFLIDTRRQLRWLLGKLEVTSARSVALFVGCLAVAHAAYFAARHYELGEAKARALLILVTAALLWVTEAAPAFAVGILVIALQVWLLSEPVSPVAPTGQSWEASIAVLGHPLVWLFFGGFVLAAGATKTHIDRWFAREVLARFGRRPAGFLAGVMCVSFGFSMFMSNTATTAMMLALLAPVVASFDQEDPFRRALLLGTATAANLGGMGSLIGTPPNAIAAGALAELPTQHVDFLRWIAIGLPPASLLSILAWLCLVRWYPSRAKELDFKASLSESPQEEDDVPRWKWWVVALTVIGTVALWMTSSWHHLPTAVVSLLPIVVMTTTAILGPTDIRGLPWDVLFLLAGGLALGETVRSSGLAQWFVDHAPTSSSSAMGIALGMSYLCVVLSNFMSNTAAANILIPFGIGVASGFEAAVALPLALAASAAMCLPIATPPNALVFSTGGVATRDFIRVGLVMGVIAPWIAVAWTAWLT